MEFQEQLDTGMEFLGFDPVSSGSLEGDSERSAGSVSCDDMDEESVSFDDGVGMGFSDDKVVLDYIAKFYAKLEGKLFVPASTVQKICNSLAFLSEVLHARLKGNLIRNLKKMNMSENEVDCFVQSILMDDVLYNSHHKTSLCESLSTTHLRTNYFKKHFQYVPATEINLSRRDPQNRSATVQYIDPKETLRVMLADPSVEKQIEKSFIVDEADSDVIKNYTDGSVFKKRNLPPKRIDVIIHQDAFLGALNPLGSAKDKYKTLAVYMTIGNLRPHVRSRLRAKRLVMLVFENYTRDEFLIDGLNKSFRKLEEDFCVLETNGILFKGEIIPFYVQFILGDHLGEVLLHFSNHTTCTFQCSCKNINVIYLLFW